MKRRRMLILVAAILLAAGAWLLFAHSGEPRYEGKTVSYWFQEYCYSVAGPRTDDADEGSALPALKALGTNAVPFLVQEALDTNEDSALKSKIEDLADKYRDSLPMPRIPSHEARRYASLDALDEIDAPPELLLAELQDALNGSSPDQQFRAVLILAHAKQQSPASVPGFIRALKFSSRDARDEAAYGLGKLRERGGGAIPELQAAFDREGDAGVQIEICAALCEMDPGQTNSLSFLTNLLSGGARSKYAT